MKWCNIATWSPRQHANYNGILLHKVCSPEHINTQPPHFAENIRNSKTSQYNCTRLQTNPFWSDSALQSNKCQIKLLLTMGWQPQCQPYTSFLPSTYRTAHDFNLEKKLIILVNFVNVLLPKNQLSATRQQDRNWSGLIPRNIEHQNLRSKLKASDRNTYITLSKSRR
jgi:hypothetical protein